MILLSYDPKSSSKLCKGLKTALVPDLHPLLTLVACVHLGLNSDGLSECSDVAVLVLVHTSISLTGLLLGSTQSSCEGAPTLRL